MNYSKRLTKAQLAVAYWAPQHNPHGDPAWVIVIAPPRKRPGRRPGAYWDTRGTDTSVIHDWRPAVLLPLAAGAKFVAHDELRGPIAVADTLDAAITAAEQYAGWPPLPRRLDTWPS